MTTFPLAFLDSSKIQDNVQKIKDTWRETKCACTVCTEVNMDYQDNILIRMDNHPAHSIKKSAINAHNMIICLNSKPRALGTITTPQACQQLQVPMTIWVYIPEGKITVSTDEKIYLPCQKLRRFVLETLLLGL
jgi:hypothetical protein